MFGPPFPSHFLVFHFTPHPVYFVIEILDGREAPISKRRLGQVDRDTPARIIKGSDRYSIAMLPITVALGAIPSLEFGELVVHGPQLGRSNGSRLSCGRLARSAQCS